ncbi:hypothetical protein PABG_11950 [Paracoccidioides brasiliensis Pb03]|nr:hypothetical protein PABG_11950 [Paracoccidioides brasiliensis Pb03]
MVPKYPVPYSGQGLLLHMNGIETQAASGACGGGGICFMQDVFTTWRGKMTFRNYWASHRYATPLPSLRTRPATNFHAPLRVLRLLIIAGEKGPDHNNSRGATSLEHMGTTAEIEIVQRGDSICIKLSTDCGRREISKD